MKQEDYNKDALIACIIQAGIIVVAFTLLMVIGCLFFSSCTAKKVVTERVKDSVRIETKYKVELRTDTVRIEIPAQTAERETKDSVSFLQNDYATSLAVFHANGILFHSLKLKPQKKSVPVSTPVITRDSVIYRDVQAFKPVYVERELTKWQAFRVKWFTTVCALLLLAIIYISRKQICRLLKLLKGGV